MDVIEGFLGDHRDMDALVQFALVGEDAVIERIAEQVADRGKRQGLPVGSPDNACRCKLPLDGGQGISAGGETLQNRLHLGKHILVRLNGAEPGFVEISKRGQTRKNAPTDLLADAAPDVHGEVADILVGHAKFDGDHEDVVGRQIRFLESADFLNDAALQEADDFSAVVEIAGQAVKLPCKDCVGFALLNPAKQVVEDFPSWLLRALALRECVNDGHSFPPRYGIQFRKLRVNREHLTILVLGGFAAVDEVFTHGQMLPCDIYDCEKKMKRNAKKMLSEDAFRTLRGASPQERLLHRLHSVVLVLSGLSASEAGRIFNDSPRAVAYWVKRFGKSGLDGLKDESRPGRPARLNEAQMATLQTFVRRRYAHSQAVGGAMLAAYIKQEFGIALTARQCWRILKRLSA